MTARNLDSVSYTGTGLAPVLFTVTLPKMEVVPC
jgi:hypothetical protein